MGARVEEEETAQEAFSLKAEAQHFHTAGLPERVLVVHRRTSVGPTEIV